MNYILISIPVLLLLHYWKTLIYVSVMSRVLSIKQLDYYKLHALQKFLLFNCVFNFRVNTIKQKYKLKYRWSNDEL